MRKKSTGAAEARPTAIHGSAQIRLEHDQCHANQNRSNSRKDGLQQIFFAKFQVVRGAATQVEKPSEIEDGGEFRQFGRLNLQRTQFYPAMRGVGFVEKESANEHDEDHAKNCVDYGGFAQLVIIELHQREHAQKAGD
jgi:hypothetical protein